MNRSARTIQIAGAFTAGSLAPSATAAAPRSAHAPAPAGRSGHPCMAPVALAAASDDSVESESGVWIELEQMLKAREAARRLHPAGSRR